VTDVALELERLQHTFSPGTPAEQRALQGVSLVVEPGQIVAVLGFNGSGKSTLLNAVAGSVLVNHGTVRIVGRDVTRWPEHRRASLIGRVFQNPFSGTASHLGVAENLAIAVHRGRRRGVFRRGLTAARMGELTERVRGLGLGLEDRLNTPMGALSGGQRQALTLLMATLVRPQLLLLDEHTAALDPVSAEQVVHLTESMVRGAQLTTLLVTHSMQQAVRLGDRVIMMHRGRIVQDIHGPRKRRLKVDDLLEMFDRMKNVDLLDESAAAMLGRGYV
jgi:putative ABC transport system ATP-binding protein